MTAPTTQTGSAGTAQGAGTGTATNETAQGAGAAVAARGTESGNRRSEVSAFAERMLAKYGTYERALDAIANENYDYREAARTDASTIATLTATQIPKGGKVLTGDDVKHWEKIVATGVPVDKVAETLTRAKELEEKQAKADKAKLFGDVAKAAKMDPDVLAPLLDQFGLAAEIRKEKVAGANGTVVDGEVAYVRSATDKNAAWEKLVDFAAKEGSPLKPFAVALKPKGQQGGQQSSTSESSSASSFPQGGTTHAFDGDGGMFGDGIGSADQDFVAKRIERSAKAASSRPNPLAPQKPAEAK